VTNPAPCVLDDGRILLYYRSNTPHGLRIGAAVAAGPGEPFERLSDDPVLVFEGDNHVKDPYVWRAGVAQPTHLFCATGDGPGGFRNATRTWNVVLPLGGK
jgi:hypothetical protein